MTTKWLGFLSFGAVLLASSSAFAQETTEPTEGEKKEQEPAEHEEAETKGSFVADFVLGFGKSPLTVSNPTSTAQPQPGARAGDGQVTTESLIVGGAYELFPHTSFGARIPLSFGELHPNGGTMRSTGTVGNLELIGEYEKHMSPHLALVLEMGVSLPTASGQNRPEDLEGLSPNRIDTSTWDKAAVNRAASLARGGEDTALFAVERLGLNPKVGAVYTQGKLRFAGSVKMENLFATTDRNGGEKYVGELVPKVRAAYRATKTIEPALAVYAPITYAGTEPGEDAFGLVVEPQVVGYVGAFRPALGIVLPVVGPASDPTTVGVRLALAAVF
jgi:hypothetical protein